MLCSHTSCPPYCTLSDQRHVDPLLLESILYSPWGVGERARWTERRGAPGNPNRQFLGGIPARPINSITVSCKRIAVMAALKPALVPPHLRALLSPAVSAGRSPWPRAPTEVPQKQAAPTTVKLVAASRATARGELAMAVNESAASDGARGGRVDGCTRAPRAARASSPSRRDEGDVALRRRELESADREAALGGEA